MPTTIKDLQRDRAKKAYDCIQEVLPKGKDEYLSLVRSLPAMILTNGLCSTVAFLKAKPERRLVYNHLREGLNLFPLWTSTDDDLLKRLIDETDQHYISQNTREALAFASHLKRFAEAYLDTKTAQGGGR